jgi:2,4-dienoyl-CoA reductase-like NADH-dependent reductase (Old Yellow Enzyme family)
MESAHLFSTITIKDLELKNRVVVSPMQQYSSIDGKITDWHLCI